MRRTTLLLTALAVLLPLASAQAEDDTAAKAAFETAIAALPAPSAKHAFTFECEALMNGNPFGTITFKAEPTSDGTSWMVSDVFSFMGGTMVRNSTAVLDRKLQPVSGGVKGKEPGNDGFEISWSRAETGFTVKKTAAQAGEATTSEETLEQAGTLTTTLASLFLFARASGMAQGSYAVMVFDADPGPGTAAFEMASWTQGEEGTWGEKKALLLKGAKGGNEMEIGFDPETGDLLGMRTKSAAQGFDMELRPTGTKPAEEQADDIFARPAKTAQEAALQAGLAFATGDVELVERITHWPTIHARAAEGHAGEEPFPDLETFKADLLEQLKKSLPQMPRPMIEGMLKTMGSQLQTEALEGGLTKVTFPAMFRNMVVTVGAFDGAWHLARMPGAPK